MTEPRTAAGLAANPAAAGDTGPSAACLFSQTLHEPFYCRLHGSVRLSLSDTQCRAARPTAPAGDTGLRERIERLRQRDSQSEPDDYWTGWNDALDRVLALASRLPVAPASTKLDVDDDELDEALRGYFAARDAAVASILAHRASPPEYPGLALVPVADLDALAANYPLPPAPSSASTAEREAAWLIEVGQSEGFDVPQWWIGGQYPRWTTVATEAQRFATRAAANGEIRRLSWGLHSRTWLGRATEHVFLSRLPVAPASTGPDFPERENRAPWQGGPK